MSDEALGRIATNEDDAHGRRATKWGRWGTTLTTKEDDRRPASSSSCCRDRADCRCNTAKQQRKQAFTVSPSSCCSSCSSRWRICRCGVARAPAAPALPLSYLFLHLLILTEHHSATPALSFLECSSSSRSLLSLRLLRVSSAPQFHGASIPASLSSTRRFCHDELSCLHLGKMNSRVREDEKHEMIIRKLLKNTDNKRCINCGSLGPQYVCTNFSIFVCTYCSGAHREFSHRIKSISMAKFTPGEVANLQSGGNGRAREIYLKELDLVRNPLPDSSDSIKLRNFINHVYVERRYTGERPAPTKNQEGGRDDNDYRRPEMRKPGLQSPSRDDQTSDRRPNDRFNDRARKSDVGGYQNEKRSPNQFESDRPPRKSYDDRDGRRDEKAIPEATRDRAKPPVRPFNFRNSEDDGPPIRSVKEILGDDVPSLRVDLNGRSFVGRIPAPVGLQKDGRSQSLDHLSNEEATAAAPAVKRVSSESMISLIDFGADPEPVVISAPVSDPFAPPSATKQVSDPFAPAPASAPAPAPANASVLDLFGSDPFAVTAVSKPAADPFAPVTTLKQAPDPFGFGGQGTAGGSGTPSWATFDFTGNPAPPEGYPGAPPASTATNSVTAQFSGGAAWDTNSSAGGGGWSAFGLQSAAPPALVPSSAPAPVVASSSQLVGNQQFNMFSSIEGQTNVTQSSMQMQMGFPPQPSPAEMLQAPTSASGRVRRELPQDFFAQPGAFGMDARQDVAFSMGAAHMGAPQFPQRGQQVATQPSRTRNPFDDDDPPPAPFNMGSMQAALPQVGDPLAGLASQWGQSFQPTATPAGAYGYGMQSTNNLHQQNGQGGAFAQNQGFNQGAMYGGSPFYSQTAGSNPFG